MHRKPLALAGLVLALAALACGATDALTGGDNLTAVPGLWPDVPAMDGMTSTEQIEMPVWLKAIARPIIDTMMKGLNDGQDAGSWDWVAFMLKNGELPSDVEAFYTPERMAEFGWTPAEAACMPMTEKGVLCSFTKNEAGTTTGLIIIAARDDQSKETSVFFLRGEGVEGTPTPTAN